MRRGLALLAIAAAQAAMAGPVFTLTDSSGLSAELEFTLTNPTTLVVRARNTSTGVPSGFTNADQLLTGISWDFGATGVHAGDPAITGGTVAIGPSSLSLNFDTGSHGPGTDVGGEYGYSNLDSTGLLPNFVSAESSLATPFGGPNLDGPVNIDGPQAGRVANPVLVPLAGLGAIQDEIIATLTINQPLSDLGFLAQNLVRVEFGSDAAFITSPEPGALALLAWRPPCSPATQVAYAAARRRLPFDPCLALAERAGGSLYRTVQLPRIGLAVHRRLRGAAGAEGFSRAAR